MQTRTRWAIIFVVCLAAVFAGLVYAYLLPSGQSRVPPFLIGAPFAALARIAWQRLRSAA
jgi:hypothetical protein